VRGEDTTERCVIVGAGPAGLAAAAGAAQLRPLVLERGPDVGRRSQDDPESIVQGVGGAGLYSDGKFSFWPSATALWRLDPALLLPAYTWFATVLSSCSGIDAPPQPADQPRAAAGTGPGPGVRRDKSYPSVYASPEARASLVADLASAARVEPDVAVEAVEPGGGSWTVTVRTAGRRRSFTAGAVIVAGGRFGGLLTAHALPAAHRTLRLEAGVRIEQPAGRFFLADDPRVDPKIIWTDETARVSWRTFCCCREGVVALTRSHGVASVSGRADCAPSGRSNVGFNVRLLDPSDIVREWPPLLERLRLARFPAEAPLAALLPGGGPDSEADALRAVLGPMLSARLAQGLALLVRDFPGRHLETARVVGPTVEGVGMYLDHDDRLATRLAGLWVAGDAAGTFRGLTAALVSGHVAGSAAAVAAR
jgi:uncharacterized FAD-dependent dehydrogenase